jgi:hypothetical protein
MPETRVIERAEATYGDYSTKELRQELRSLEDQFEMAGGRGVSLADRLDAVRIALALRSSKNKQAHATKAVKAPISTEPGATKEKLQQAAKWIRRELSKRGDSSHPSHLASKVLEEADKKFNLGSYGVEGWAKSPSLGYPYLNYGDPYDATIVVRSNPTKATVFVALGGWASYAPAS